MPRAPSRDFRARYGPWALVAGASQGLGMATRSSSTRIVKHVACVKQGK